MISQLGVRERLELYLRTARRSRRRGSLRLVEVVGPLASAGVFVVGSPRSGTTVTAEAIGAAPGFVDLGEVNRFKRAIPDLVAAAQDRRPEVVAEIGRILRTSHRVAGAARRRPVEQTPESAYLISEIAEAFPEARFVHLVRDGRDVAASLLRGGWLSDRPDGRTDDAGVRTGAYARFWVEPGREREFEAASDIRRCAWAWRRYETAAAQALAVLPATRSVTVRYEDLAADPAVVAATIAQSLEGPVPDLVASFGRVHGASVGRHRDVLSAEQVAELDDEAGPLLSQLGYT